MISNVLFPLGSRAVRQLLPPVHQLLEGQDADRPGHRRAGRGFSSQDGGPARRLQQQRQPKQRRLDVAHRRGVDARSGE